MLSAQLRASWRDQYRKPARDIGPDLLRRGSALARIVEYLGLHGFVGGLRGSPCINKRSPIARPAGHQ